jgi:hypothetical protein
LHSKDSLALNSEDFSLDMTVVEKRSLALTTKERSLSLTAAEDGASGINIK